MKMIRYILAMLVTVVLVPDSAAAEDAAALRSGNALYRQGKYDQALEQYNEALVSEPDSAVGYFNRAAALYRKKDYEAAIDSFTKALLTDDPELEAQANYNIGNAKYRQGRLKEQTNLQEAVNLFRDAISYYKRAIELDRENRKAKFNHEFVEKKIKHLLDQMKNKQQQQQKQKRQQGEGEQEQKQEQAQQKQQKEQPH